MSAAHSLVPAEVDVAETVRAMEDELQASRAEVERLRLALSRISGFCSEARADSADEEGVGMAGLAYVSALARAALRNGGNHV